MCGGCGGQSMDETAKVDRDEGGQWLDGEDTVESTSNQSAACAIAVVNQVGRGAASHLPTHTTLPDNSPMPMR
jgi:hypothetical protein